MRYPSPGSPPSSFISSSAFRFGEKPDGLTQRRQGAKKKRPTGRRVFATAATPGRTAKQSTAAGCRRGTRRSGRIRFRASSFSTFYSPPAPLSRSVCRPLPEPGLCILNSIFAFILPPSPVLLYFLLSRAALLSPFAPCGRRAGDEGPSVFVRLPPSSFILHPSSSHAKAQEERTDQTGRRVFGTATTPGRTANHSTAAGRRQGTPRSGRIRFRASRFPCLRSPLSRSAPRPKGSSVFSKIPVNSA